ncbi:MAG: tetratricopeptide repeat protein [Candidatus Hodarchaeales archaeon]|jgi:tetratricopeptide (TPR) repeat protein
MSNWAFLVGVSNYYNRYSSSELKSFEFCDRHVFELADILMDDEDYEEQSIKIGTSEGKTGYTSFESTRNNIIIEFDELLKKIKPKSTLLIYFIGHGGMFYNSSYFFPKDACISKDDNLLKETSISINSLNSQLEHYQTKNKNIFFIIDACRSREIETLNVSESENESKDRFDYRYIPRVIENYPSVISYLFSASPRQYARPLMYNGRQHSIFSYALLNGLREEIRRPITYGKLVHYVFQQVPLLSNSKQIPNDKSSFLAYDKSILGSSEEIAAASQEDRNALLEFNQNLRNLNNIIENQKNEAKEVSYEIKQDLQRYLSIFKDRFSNNLDMLNPELLLNLGIAYCENENHRHAMWAFKTAITIDDSAETYFRLGKVYLRLKLFKEAEEAFRKTIESNPKCAEAWYQIGHLSYDNRIFDKAEEYFKIAIRHRPHYIECKYQLGLLFFDLMRLNDAEKTFREVIDYQSDHADAWNNLGDLLFYYRKKYKNAEKAFREAIRLKKDHILASYNLANLLSRDRSWYQRIRSGFRVPSRKMYKEAEELYRECYSIDSSFIPAYINLGVLLYKQDRLPEATIYLYKAHDKASSRYKALDILAWYNLGTVLNTQCERVIREKDIRNLAMESIKAYKKALSIAPADWNLRTTVKARLDKLEKETLQKLQ